MKNNQVVIRLRTRKGLKRFTLPSLQSTFGQFQQLVVAELQIPIEKQNISLNPPESKSPLLFTNASNKTLSSLNLKHGDMLYLVDSSLSNSGNRVDKLSISSPIAPFTRNKLSELCSHPPNVTIGRCIHCDPAPVNYQPETKCNHGVGAKCIYCNKGNSTDTLSTAWCTHADTSFCPMCLPKKKSNPDGVQDTTSWGCHCDRSKGQRCIYCVNPPKQFKIDLPSYHQFLNERKALCHFKHPPNQRCYACAPPVLPNFKGNPKCTSSHRPYPQGSCLKCIPSNACLILQPYRHTSYVSFVAKGVFDRWLLPWTNNIQSQICGLLYGKIINSPESRGDFDSKQAQIYAVYSPKQTSSTTHATFESSSYDKVVDSIASEFGIEVVGWIVTSMVKYGDQYGGKMLLSAPYIRQAARFQDSHLNSDGFSNFVTVVISDDQDNRAFQISDQAVALERDGILADSKDIGLLKVRKSDSHEILPKLIYKNKMLNENETFLPDEFLVKVILSESKIDQTLFKYNDFPSIGSVSAFRNWMRVSSHSKEPIHIKFSDFNLLCFLPKIIGIDLTLRICKAIRAGIPVSMADIKLIERALKEVMK